MVGTNGESSHKYFSICRIFHRESHEQCVISRCQSGVQWKVSLLRMIITYNYEFSV